MSLNHAKWWIGGVWILGAGAIGLLLALQSMMNRYGQGADEVWAWFLPTVMPTLSLIVAVLASDFRAAGGPGGSPQPVVGPMLWLALGLSVIYLLLVALAILLPILRQVPLLENLHRSNLWLGPFQGLTLAALGAFFRRN